MRFEGQSLFQELITVVSTPDNIVAKINCFFDTTVID